MRKYILILSLMLITSIVSAQEWSTDFESSMVRAKQENKKLILVFQGSDWCGTCIKLDKQVWSTPEFEEYAKQNYVLVKADFPRSKKNKLSAELEAKNNALAEKYNKQGSFPMVVIFNSQGEVIGVTGYKKYGATEYIEHINSF